MLPTQKTPPKTSHADLTVLVYGSPKIGKSEWCSKAEGALFLATEPGLNNLEVFQVPIDSWQKLLTIAAEIAEGKHEFKTIVLDTVDNAYRMCAEHVCKKYGVEHESDLEFGKGYALVNSEFQRVLTKLAQLPYGLILVSHAQEREIETRTGKVTRIVPTLPDKARKIVLGFVDIILYCDIELATGADGQHTSRRVLRTKPHANYEAGDRTGRLPEVLDLDYAKFAEACATPTPPTPSPTPAPPTAPAAAPPVAPAPRLRAVATRSTRSENGRPQ